MDTTRTTTPSAEPGIGDGVRAVLVEVLGLEARAHTITPHTGLLGELPELDSLSVVELAAALEDRFGIVIDDQDFTGEVFESLASLTALVAERVRSTKEIGELSPPNG